MNPIFKSINFEDHPTNHRMTVFSFDDQERSAAFKSELLKAGISYEYQIDEETGRMYFGISKTNFKAARRINFLVHGQFRKPFIPNPLLRGLVILISIIVVSLALIGIWRS